MFELKLFLQASEIGKLLYYLFFVLSAFLLTAVFAAVNFKARHMRAGTVSLFSVILLFAAFFLWLDDVFYGRKPKAKPLSKWMVKGK